MNTKLHISDNHKYIIEEDERGGKSQFFWLGDTAWFLFEKLTLPEIRMYFKDRAEKHFNVIQVVIANAANVKDGEGLPFEWDETCRTVLNSDFAQIDYNSPYWNKIDQVIELAAEYHLYIGLLPVWGSMVKLGYLNMDNVKVYADYLVNRYGNKPNIIWMLGGDVRGDVGFDVWNTFGTILREGCPDNLITFHPFGRTSSEMWFHNQNWLDFNLFQSGHRRYDQGNLGLWDDNNVSEDFFGEDNWRYVQRALKRDVLKPILDAEPSYEALPQGLHDTTQPYWQPKDVRRYAYWSVFQGACGHTYGHNSVMQFYRDFDQKKAYGAKEFWNHAIHAAGTLHMKYLYELMTSVDFTSGVYKEELLAEAQRTQYYRISPFAGKDFALFYDYTGRSIKIDLSKLGFTVNSVQWFDPASGEYTASYIENEDLEHPNLKEFVPANKESGDSDWVLVLKK